MTALNAQSIARPVGKPGESPEFHLLRWCAQSRLDDGAVEELRNLAQGDLDPIRVTDAARWQHITPLVFEHLRTVLPAGNSTEILEALRPDYEANASRAESLTAELFSILAELQTANIPAIPFKGPALALSNSQTPALRQFINLDILIRREDVAKVSGLLVGRGYQAVKASEFMDAEALLHLESKLGFHNPVSGLSVELHVQIVPRRYCYRLQFDHLFRRSQSVSTGGGEMRVLSPEDTLIVLCLHAIKGGFWPSLKQVVDVAEVIKAHDRINWQVLIEESVRRQCDRAVFLGLLLARELLDAQLPDDVRAEILRDPVVPALAEFVQTRLGQQQRGFPNLMEATRVHLRLRKGLLSKARYLFCIITTPSERDFQFLGRHVSLAQSYPIRLVKFAQKFVDQVSKAVFRR